jgi:hypothetical protein
MINFARRSIRTVSIACALGATGLLAPIVSAAQADVVGIDSCSPEALSRPFARWLDVAKYEVAPAGDFENSGWTLTGGATPVAGSEPYAVTGTLGSSSLSLPAGSTAQSPMACVDATHPSVRFFIAGSGSVAVNVVDGDLVIPAGVAVADGAWSPTPVMVTASAVLSAVSGGTAQVSVTVTALAGRVRIDDVFIDPWRVG